MNLENSMVVPKLDDDETEIVHALDGWRIFGEMEKSEAVEAFSDELMEPLREGDWGYQYSWLGRVTDILWLINGKDDIEGLQKLYLTLRTIAERTGQRHFENQPMMMRPQA